jgi:hypothetical protein
MFLVHTVEMSRISVVLPIDDKLKAFPAKGWIRDEASKLTAEIS